MELQDTAASRVTIGLPLGLALLLASLIFIIGFFCCCLHWNKFKFLFPSSNGVMISSQADLTFSPQKPAFPVVETTKSFTNSSTSDTAASVEVIPEPSFTANTPCTRSGRKAIQEHKLLAERGFDLSVLLVSMRPTLEALEWITFAAHPTEKPNVTITQEFYSNISLKKNKPEDYSVVRKRLINFEAAAINQHLGLSYEGDNFSNALEGAKKAEIERIKKRLGKPGVEWYTKECGEFKLKICDLHDEAKYWYFIVSHKLMPTSNVTYIDKTRLVLLDLIVQGKKVNVGKIVEAAIKDCKSRQGGFLYFPCLITSLCLAAGVPPKEEDIKWPLQMAVTEVTMGRRKSKKQPPKQEKKPADASASATTEDKIDADVVALLQQHISKTEIFWGYARRHNEWLHAMLCDNLDVDTAPQFPEGLLPSDVPQPSMKRKRDSSDKKGKAVMSDSSSADDTVEENDDSLTSTQQNIANYYDSPPSATEPGELQQKKTAEGAGTSTAVPEPVAAAGVQQPEEPLQTEVHSDTGTELVPEEEEHVAIEEDKRPEEVTQENNAEKEVNAEMDATKDADPKAAGKVATVSEQAAAAALLAAANVSAGPHNAEAATNLAALNSKIKVKSTFRKQGWVKKMNQKASAQAQLKKDLFGSSEDK